MGHALLKSMTGDGDLTVSVKLKWKVARKGICTHDPSAWATASLVFRENLHACLADMRKATSATIM